MGGVGPPVCVWPLIGPGWPDLDPRGHPPRLPPQRAVIGKPSSTPGRTSPRALSRSGAFRSEPPHPPWTLHFGWGSGDPHGAKRDRCRRPPTRTAPSPPRPHARDATYPTNPGGGLRGWARAWRGPIPPSRGTTRTPHAYRSARVGREGGNAPLTAGVSRSGASPPGEVGRLGLRRSRPDCPSRRSPTLAPAPGLWVLVGAPPAPARTLMLGGRKSAIFGPPVLQSPGGVGGLRPLP